jgi:uncharacterized membrane protein YccC
MWGILVVGSLWFWLLLIVSAILVTILIQSEEGGWATFAFIVTILLLNYAFKAQILKALVVHPLTIIKWAVGYFVAGASWGTLKWWDATKKALNKYNEVKVEFLSRHNATELTEALAQVLADTDAAYNHVSPIPPAARDHKGDIIRWMAYWPFSFVGTILNDVVRNAWNHIYAYMVGTYDKISRHVFRHVSQDAELFKQNQKKSKIT